MLLPAKKPASSALQGAPIARLPASAASRAMVGVLRGISRALGSFVLELRAPPGERGFESVPASDLFEFLANFGRGRVERRAHVEARLQRIAETGDVGAAVDRELGSGERLGCNQRHALCVFHGCRAQLL